MTKPLSRVLSIFAAFSIITPALSLAATTYSPANFNFSGAELKPLVAKPYIFTSRTPLPVMYCQSEINAAGQASKTACHDASGNYHVEILTEGAINKLSFTPATVNAKAVPVRMSYRVVFSGETDDVTVSLIPNLGSMQSKFGVNYFAPQERLDVADWQQEFNKKSNTNGSPFLDDAALSRIATTVNAKGKPVSVKALSVERGKKKDAKIAKNALKKARFIPGFVNGKAQTVSHLSVINYNKANANQSVASN